MKKSLFVSVAAILVMALFFSCSPEAIQSSSDTYSTPTVKGTVSIPDNSDVKPEDIYVKVIDSSDKTVTIQKVNADSTFTVSNLNADMKYRILFTSVEPDYTNRSLMRGKGSSNGVGGWLKDVVPAIKEGYDIGSVKMKPLGTIKGKALVDGADSHYDTTVYIPGTSFIAMTDEEGNFSIYDVPEGTYTLRYTHEDCVAVMKDDVILVCPEEQEHPEKVVGKVSLFSNKGTVEGIAVFGDSSDSTGINIRLESEDNSKGMTALTDKDGNYVINNVEPGRYRIVASSAGYLSVTSEYFDVATATVTTVEEKLELLGDYGTVKGKVSLEDSETKEGIQILIRDTSSTNSYSVMSDDTGSFIKRVKPGEYTVTVYRTDYTSQSKTVTVIEDSTVELSFNPLVSIYGTISGTSNTEGETVSLMKGTTVIRTVVTGSDRKYEFSAVEAGTYSLRFSKDGSSSYTTDSITLTGGASLTANGKALTSLYGTVTGYVTLEGASDNAGATITLTSSSDTSVVYNGTSSADGSFRITQIAKSGTYLLTYSKDGYVSNLSNSVDITVGKVVTADSVTLKSVMSTVSGKIQLDGTSTHENVTILLKNETNQYNATTDQKGEYKINRVLPGTYTLMASKDGYVTASTNDFVIESSSEKEVELLTLSVAIRSITGSVKLELLDDYAGALVTATNLADSTDVYSAITNSAGDYTLAGMTPGEYSIVISYNGYRTATLATVNVVSSTVTTIPLTEMKINRGTITGVAKLEGRSSSEDITVELLRGTDVYALTYTDDSGSYSFYVPQGNYTGVRYSKTDFASSSVSKDIALFADNYFSMGNETLTATHNSVYGTVDVLTTDDESAVTISFDGVSSIDSYVTTTDGTFKFEHLPVGKYTLRFQRQDCSDITIPVEVKASDGINLGKVEITPNTATVKGKVNLDNGTSLSGVRVSVDLGTKVLETLTDDSGRYEIGGISIADEYTVTYSKDGWDSKTQKITPKLNILEVRELDEITLVDTTAPVLSSVVINSGANTTANKKITLNLSSFDIGSGLEKIMVTYDDIFDKTVRRNDYSSILEWELPAENGLKTIYVRVVDRAGNESATVAASVTLTDQKTEVSGTMLGENLTWTKSKSPYLVTGTVIVKKGTTLTIEPGVDVQFAGSYAITVEGTIKAIGTEAEKISFYGVDEGENDWIGINGRNNIDSMLKYCDIRGTTKGLQGKLSVFVSKLTSDSYALYGFSGEIDDSVVDGVVHTSGGTLLNNELNLISGKNINVFDDSLLTGNIVSGNSVDVTFTGVGENNSFTGLSVEMTAGIKNCTFKSCSVGFEEGSYYSCVFDSCSFGNFKPAIIRDSNFIDFGVITITTNVDAYTEFDLTSNFWGYVNTKELEDYGVERAHGFIVDYFSDSESSLTKGNISGYRSEPNKSAGYKGIDYYSYPAESTIVYEIGDPGPAGGKVFYDKGYYSNGWRYLECSVERVPESQYFGLYRSSDTSTNMVLGTSLIIGTGKFNTSVLCSGMGAEAYIKESVAEKSSEYSAKACSEYEYGGYSDWFLPSVDELYQIFSIREKLSDSIYKTGNYWSSSERGATWGWEQNMENGSQYVWPGRITLGHDVLAIRAF